MTTAKPSRIRMLARGATRRCARCGAGGLFHKWFRMVPDCPRCGLHFEREEGYWSGAIAINTIIIGGIFAIVFIATMALTVPDIPWVGLLMAVIPIMSIGPLIVYPFSKTLWLAVDLAFLEPLGIRLDGG
ncbi:MAG TPA: DUF983 domain-containing protein [Acidimicrobiia bacterium]|jgi:uncharacterized protein (DUF983 family)|nr:DUF983 domain-containing protein [Acidimicrobiia bacterium]